MGYLQPSSDAWNQNYFHRKCQVCGTHYGIGRHHITPLAEGGANHPRNIIYVCNPHHDVIEGMNWNQIQNYKKEYQYD